jgi:toxin YoeB
MDLIFNELSIFNKAPDKITSDNRMKYLLETCKQMQPHGFNKLRMNTSFLLTEISENYTINDWLSESKSIYKSLFIGFIKQPFIDDNDEEATNTYINHNITLVEPSHILHGKNGEGISTAWIKNSICVSFFSHKIWEKSLLNIEIVSELDNSQKNVVIPNIYTPQSCSYQPITTWLEKLKEIKVIDSNTLLTKYPATLYRFEEKAIEDILYFLTINKLDLVARIEEFLNEIAILPFIGKGKPEPLKGNYQSWWSRRINEEHRFIYKVENDKIFIKSSKGHYQDK